MSQTIAIVLPPREGFGPGRTGAVGLIAHRLAASGPFAPLVIGGSQAGPVFGDVPFRAARPVRWLPLDPNRRFAAGVARLLRRDPPALIEVHNRAEIALFLAARFPAIPVSLFLHNDPQGMRSLRTAAARARLPRRLAAVVAVSRYVRDRLLDGVAPPHRAPVVLPNCVDLAGLPPPIPPEAREAEILFVGRLVSDKAPDVFIAACAAALPRLPGWRATMLGADRFRSGGADTAYIRALRPAARDAGVNMRGYQTHETVLQTMARAAILVMPSRWQEPFGLTALEAMACGMALIYAPRGGLPEVAGGAAVQVNPDRPDQVAEAIVALATDPSRRADIARAGLDRARLFDLPIATTQLGALRRSLIGG